MTVVSIGAGGLLCVMLIWLSWFDIKYGVLPDLLTLALMWAGLLINIEAVSNIPPHSIRYITNRRDDLHIPSAAP